MRPRQTPTHRTHSLAHAPPKPRTLHLLSAPPPSRQIPTFRAYPLQPACDTWCEFPVKDRANAVVQWLMAAEADATMVKGAWLLMLESDYVWRRPLQVIAAVLCRVWASLGCGRGSD
jgi:hypothetical protein